MTRVFLLVITSALLFLSSLACSPSNRSCTSNDDCLGGEVCKSATCTSSTGDQCDVCTAGKKRCVDGKAQTCIKLSSGCTDWGQSKTCPEKQSCQGGECKAACEDECTKFGDTKCNDKSSFMTCESSKNGCLVWSSQTSCKGGEICQEGICKAAKKSEGERCLGDECNSGLQCVGTEKDGFFCRRFCSRSKDCNSGEGCYEIKGGAKMCFPRGKFGPPSDAKCQIYADSATINGGNWDIGGGAPDPYVSVSFNSASKFVSRTVSDSFSPSWKELSGRDYTYQDIYSMTVSLIDEDLSSSDTMATWTADGGRWKMTGSSQSFTLKNKSGSITLKIEVRCTL